MRAIAAGTDKGATQRAQSLGAAKASELRARIGPYFLRREKQHVLKSSSERCANASHAISMVSHLQCMWKSRIGLWVAEPMGLPSSLKLESGAFAQRGLQDTGLADDLMCIEN